MRRPFRTHGKFYRNGEGDHGRMSRFRSFCTLRAALNGVRKDIAELEADGVKLPAWTAIWYELPDSEIVAIWKRGRFVWVDPLFKKMESSLTRRESKNRIRPASGVL